jgi:hypothetical protein
MEMTSSRLKLLGLLAGCVSVSAFAQSTRDVRCLVLSNAFAASATQADARKAAQSATLFFAGKVTGERNDARLRALVSQQRAALTKARAGTEMKACVQQMQTSLRRLTALGSLKAEK